MSPEVKVYGQDSGQGCKLIMAIFGQRSNIKTCFHSLSCQTDWDVWQIFSGKASLEVHDLIEGRLLKECHSALCKSQRWHVLSPLGLHGSVQVSQPMAVYWILTECTQYSGKIDIFLKNHSLLLILICSIFLQTSYLYILIIYWAFLVTVDCNSWRKTERQGERRDDMQQRARSTTEPELLW